MFPGTAYRGMTVADPSDIAVMKIVAIGGRGSRKDFVDLFYMLRSGIALDVMFEMLRKRFRGIDYNEYHLRKSLVYFADAESEPMPEMIRKEPESRGDSQSLQSSENGSLVGVDFDNP